MIATHRVHAVGIFEVTDWQEETFEDFGEGARQCRAKITCEVKGAVEGIAHAEYLITYPNRDFACFVGVQNVEAVIEDRRGRFALQVYGTFDGRVARATWCIVPGSGREELEGLRGEGGFEAPMGTKGDYVLDYEFEERD